MTPADYNAKYADIFDPYGCAPAGPEAVEEIQEELGVSVDGYLGPKTVDAMAEGDGIIVGPQRLEMDVPVETYKEDFTLGDTAARTRREAVRQIIIHYDVSFDARATERILQNRGYSTHFIIDGDGSIIQCHNPATKVALHAGEPNDYSIGIDLNNPAATKYLDEDTRRRGRARDIVQDQIHGRAVDRLDYFPEQIETLNALLDVLCEAFDVPRDVPRDPHGHPKKTVVHDAMNFEGILGHYHWSLNKTDPAPLKWEDILG